MLEQGHYTKGLYTEGRYTQSQEYEYCFDIVNKNKENVETELASSSSPSSSSTTTKWSKLLAQYKTNIHDRRWVYMYSSVANIIYDKYPKSLIHLLVLPFNISYSDNFRVFYANKPSQFRHGHLKSLKIVHNLCRHVVNYLYNKYKNDMCLNSIDSIKIGYHIVPTMEDLHIHIISDDFIHTKNRNQRKSFYKKNFITIDEVENELELYGRILSRTSEDSEVSEVLDGSKRVYNQTSGYNQTNGYKQNEGVFRFFKNKKQKQNQKKYYNSGSNSSSGGSSGSIKNKEQFQTVLTNCK